MPETNCDTVTKNGEVKFKYAAHDSIRLLENENNACHTSSSNIFLLQHEFGDFLHHCFHCLRLVTSTFDAAMTYSCRYKVFYTCYSSC